jgi:uncharacterized membrane protein
MMFGNAESETGRVEAFSDGVLARDDKGRVSLLAYAAAIGLAFVSPWIAYALFVCIAVMWFVPDRRLSRQATPSPGAWRWPGQECR